ncbi:hypothetical protein ABT167_37430 [Streptomyces sp. NPDC001792]|uniref:hypothetical protein n=1 Tax=Streptomyces sp. NPDC001792 TaxID=3154524 RepID=UPI0033181E8A
MRLVDLDVAAVGVAGHLGLVAVGVTAPGGGGAAVGVAADGVDGAVVMAALDVDVQITGGAAVGVGVPVVVAGDLGLVPVAAGDGVGAVVAVIRGGLGDDVLGGRPTASLPAPPPASPDRGQTRDGARPSRVWLRPLVCHRLRRHPPVASEENLRTANTPQILAGYVEAAVNLRCELDALSQSATRGNAVGRPTDPATTRSRS